jgi:hypothetical protein
MKKHMNFGRAFILVLAFAFAPSNALAQAEQASKTSAGMVFEMVREGWAMGRVNATFLRLYKSGRVDYEEGSRKMGQETYRKEKTATARLGARKISELIKLANQPDFLNARSEYKAFSAGIDAGNSARVIYFRKPGKQTIELAPYFSRRGQSAEPLPPSLKEFMEKVSEIANLMEGKLRH